MESFYGMIDQLAAADAETRTRIEAQIWQRYGTDRAVLALDMSEFSLSVRRDGILPYLCRIRRMHAITRPLVEGLCGQVVKYEADNLLAVFERAADALEAAVRMRGALCADPLAQPVSVGLSWGRILLIPNRDAHGDAVNWAFKLGEDVARTGEILLSSEFHEQLAAAQAPAYRLDPQGISIAGLQLQAWRVLGPVDL